MWSFVFKTSQRLALWVLFQVWLTQLTFPTLERKLATVFITPLILVSTQKIWNHHPNFAWKGTKCFSCAETYDVPRTFTIHSKSEQVCGFYFSVSKNVRKKCINSDGKISRQKCVNHKNHKNLVSMWYLHWEYSVF